MTPEDQYIIIGLLLFLTPLAALFPWWVRELFKIGVDE